MVAHKTTTSICFSHEDLQLFSLAGHDRNPLHLSNDYARKTMYREVVVFGVLGGLACLGALPERQGISLSSVMLEFLSPMFVGIEYVLETVEVSNTEVEVTILEGNRPVLQMSASFRSGAVPTTGWKDGPAIVPRITAAESSTSRFIPDLTTEGCYRLAANPTHALLERFHLIGKGIGTLQIAALMLCSYLVGMELPGQQALFSRLSLDFTGIPTVPMSDDTIDYKAKVVKFDNRLNMLRVAVKFLAGQREIATGELRSFVRPVLPSSHIRRSGTQPVYSNALKGKVALVIGASRGLGAMISQTLVSNGCRVVANYLRSREEAEQLQASIADAPGELVLIQGDGGDVVSCEAMKNKILHRYDRLDFLICNASLSALPLSLAPTTVERINEYVEKSLALVSTPLAVFVDTLSDYSGWAIAISSSYVQQIPRELPHYVSAKYAIEGLIRATAANYRKVNFLIVRPPRLLTDLTNAPFTTGSLLPPHVVADALVQSIQNRAAPGTVEILEDFGTNG